MSGAIRCVPGRTYVLPSGSRHGLQSAARWEVVRSFVPTRSPTRYGQLMVDTAAQSASDINRELTAALVEAGRQRGFQVATEYPVPGGRLDVVWCCDVDMAAVGVEGPVPVVAFEIESSWRTRKHVKGDLLNIMDSGASVGVIVLAGTDVKDESLVNFARSLVERRGPDVRVWTADDVRVLTEAKESVQTGAQVPDEAGRFAEPISALAQYSGKYAELWRWLVAEARNEFAVTFDEIEDRIGTPLPPSCRKHPTHWLGYKGTAVGRAIRDAGWRASQVNVEHETVTLSKAQPQTY